MLKLDYDIMHSGDELKKLIAAHPDLPIIFEANDEANFGDYEVTVCTSVHARIGEILDCQQDIADDYIFTDRDAFADCVQDYIYDPAHMMTAQMIITYRKQNNLSKATNLTGRSAFL